MQRTVSDRCWATSVHCYYPVQISGFWEQLGWNRNRIVKTAGYPSIRNQISGTSLATRLSVHRRFDVVVMHWSLSTKLLYASLPGLGWRTATLYMDEWTWVAGYVTLTL